MLKIGKYGKKTGLKIKNFVAAGFSLREIRKIKSILYAG
jgi:hypothetical protein